MQSRDPALEIFRGIAILEVVLHHITGAARVNAAPWTPSNWLYTYANRTLHFAVPAFLFLMGVLLARSMVGGKRSWRDFYQRRGEQTLVPYLVWSAAYAGFALWQAKIDIAQFLSWQTWAHWLLWGKAWGHLYFLVLALQLYLILPLALALLQRWRIDLLPLLAIALLAQVALYLGHAQLPATMRLPYPASSLVWYVAPVFAGVWVGLHYEEWPKFWPRVRPIALTLLVLGAATYVPQGVRELRGEPITGLWYHAAFWAYTTGVCFSLLAFCRFLAGVGGRAVRVLQVLGVQSMQIYVMHPMLLFFWYATPQTGSTLRLHLTVLVVAFTAILLPLLFGRLANRCGIGKLLFGRTDFRLAPLPGMR